MTPLSDEQINAVYQARERTPVGHSRRWGTDIDYWASDLIRDPGDYEGCHRRDNAAVIGEVRAALDNPCSFYRRAELATERATTLVWIPLL